LSFSLREREDISIEHQIRDPEFRHPRLASTGHFTGTAELKIDLCQAEAVDCRNHCLNALAGHVVQSAWRHPNAQGLLRATSDAAAQLMQLRESESLRMFDEHDGGIRHVDTHFDDRCRYEDVDLPGRESRHRCFFFLALQAAMQECNPAALEGLG